MSNCVDSSMPNTAEVRRGCSLLLSSLVVTWNWHMGGVILSLIELPVGG